MIAGVGFARMAWRLARSRWPLPSIAGNRVPYPRWLVTTQYLSNGINTADAEYYRIIDRASLWLAQGVCTPDRVRL